MEWVGGAVKRVGAGGQGVLGGEGGVWGGGVKGVCVCVCVCVGERERERKRERERESERKRE